MTPLQTKAVKRAFDAGYFWCPAALAYGGLFNRSSLENLAIDAPVAVAALRSMTQMERHVYSAAVLEIHDRPPQFDGVVGPAMAALLSVKRCSVPDHALPNGTEAEFPDSTMRDVAISLRDASETVLEAGSGNWLGCHGVGNFHASVVRIRTADVPGFLRPTFNGIMLRVRKAYADLGLLFHFIDEERKDIFTGETWRGGVNIEFSFVSRSDGWIGLAIVGNREDCLSNIWCRYLATYRGGGSDSAIATQWTSLIKHELGHNCGLGHSRGGVMNPSIMTGLPSEWTDNDPSTSLLKTRFGGVAVDIGDEPDVPDPPVDDHDSLIARIEVLEAKQVAQAGFNQFLLESLS